MASAVRRRGQHQQEQVATMQPPPHQLPLPPPPLPMSSLPRHLDDVDVAAAAAGAPPAPARAPAASTTEWAPEAAGADGVFPSFSPWGKQLRSVLRSKLFTLANLWTGALVATVLLALIFRAMQPTEPPGVRILRYEWLADPSKPGMVRLDDVVLNIKGVGRFMMDFPATTLTIRKAPAEPGPGPMPPAPAEGEDVLASVEVPPWQLVLGHDGVVVALEQPSGAFPYDPEAVPQVLVTGVFDGVVAVYAKLPSRIYMSCRVKTAMPATDVPECWSQYMPQIKRG